ncbi:MAG: gamma-glutamyltransferase [Vicinamibacterales bacterium]
MTVRPRLGPAAVLTVAAVAVAGVTGRAGTQPAAMPALVGVQDPAWAPDGRRVAVSALDVIWTMAPDGKAPAALVAPPLAGVERDPAWSPDGSRVAFAADRDTDTGFDIYVAVVRTGTVTAVTAAAGDERWPSWTPDGRLVFAARAARPRAGPSGADPGARWDLQIARPVAGSTAWQAPIALTDTADDETFPRVSPDGSLVAFVSERSAEDDVDVWVLPLPAAAATPVALGARPAGDAVAPRATRVTRAPGSESHLAWAPDGRRLAFHAVRGGVGALWVATVELPQTEGDAAPLARPKPAAPPQLVSRRGGAPAWSPDGRTLLVAGLPEPQPVYNGNPTRDDREPAPLFAGTAAFQLWRVAAPLPVDESGGEVVTTLSQPRAWLAAFDRTWDTLRRLYYDSGPSAATWVALRDTYRPQAEAAPGEAALEAVLDAMVAEQPLIKPAVSSAGAVVVSGHPLASEAGRRVFEAGGNVVDAAIAVAFVLGVVEPEASGLGGDGSAVLFLKGMSRPTVVEYKDQTPIHATMDNPAIVRDGRLVADGPAAANIPGVVAGLDHLYRHHGSGKVTWASLVEPAAAIADQGFVLDESLPTSIAEGRRFLEKYPEAARIFLPGGRVPQPGDRFVNKDYAATLRAIARDGAETFYRGAIARRIAADMADNGGILTYADLAQYRAMERTPIEGRYRGHVLYAGGPPVSTGIQLFESLQVLGHYAPRPGATAATDADYFHHLVEAWKVRDPLRRVADPERWPVDFADHLRDDHALTLFRKIDPRRAAPYDRQTPDDGPFTPPPTRIGRGTTSFAVGDAEGNLIAVTQTLSTWGGTFYVSKGLGFLYNNHLRSTRTTPGAYGSLVPLMRSSTASVPTLVFADTPDGLVPRLAVGCAGNAWIPLSVYSVITGVVDGGLGAQQAIEAPRFLPGRDPADPLERGARIEIEDRFPRALLDDLRQRGHRFQKIGRKGEVRYGYAAAVLVDAARRRVEGGAEPRRSHAAVAAERPPTSARP